MNFDWQDLSDYKISKIDFENSKTEFETINIHLKNVNSFPKDIRFLTLKAHGDCCSKGFLMSDIGINSINSLKTMSSSKISNIENSMNDFKIRGIVFLNNAPKSTYLKIDKIIKKNNIFAYQDIEELNCLKYKILLNKNKSFVFYLCGIHPDIRNYKQFLEINFIDFKEFNKLYKSKKSLKSKNNV